jgi:trehalose 6-phosphate phosphatase
VRLPPRNRRVLEELAHRCCVAVLSGRDLRDVRDQVGVDELWYGGSHGFEFIGPAGQHVVHDAGQAALPDLDAADRRVAELDVPGMLVERKRFALAVHYRNVAAESVDRVVSTVVEYGAGFAALKPAHGRCVVELVPDVDWHKGTALDWLLDHLGESSRSAVVVYAGDDDTDENALRAVHSHGIGIVVRSSERADRLSWAHYAVAGTEALSALLERLTTCVAPGKAR